MRRYTEMEMRAALLTLSTLERTVVELRLFDDFSWAEIAATVDIAEENTERVYALAHARMTDALNHCFRG